MTEARLDEIQRRLEYVLRYRKGAVRALESQNLLNDIADLIIEARESLRARGR